MRRLVVIAVIAFTGAGCGGNGNGGVSTDDYVAKADGICGDYQVRLSRIPRPVTGSATELASYLERALPVARAQLDKLKSLERPSDDSDREDIERVLVLLDQELDFNEAARKAAATGDRASLDTNLQQQGAVAAEANQIAEQVGFVVCARRA